jgi:hypothetical protein
MDIHKNARLTLRSRELLVEIVKGGLGFSRSAASFHVTPKTAAKWVRRYQSEGAVGLRDRSSRPHRSPRATSSHRQPHSAPRSAQSLARSASSAARGAL